MCVCVCLLCLVLGTLAAMPEALRYPNKCEMALYVCMYIYIYTHMCMYMYICIYRERARYHLTLKENLRK